MKTYLTILAVISFTSGYASASGMDDIADRQIQRMNEYLGQERAYQERNAVRDQMQRRMNQQYYNDLLQGEIQQQQDEMRYQQHQEHMRNQGWGRPGLDGGGR